jgi:glycosyltransferase involved in cell wall biosynthesis
MGLGSRTVIVVPCYNEAKRLDCASFELALAQDPLLEFVFVNDGSKDATSEVLREMQRRVGNRTGVLELGANGGKANAVRAGVLQAFELQPTYIGYWDADLATSLACVELFAREMETRNVSLILGSRVRLMGRNIERSAVRHYVGRGFATLAAFSLGFPIYDTQCGAKLFRASPVFRNAFSNKFEMNWTFDVELLHRLNGEKAHAAGFEILRDCVEYPLPEWIDAPGSKLTFGQYPGILRELLQLTIQRLLHRH